jgi:hypothetical protein
MTVEQGTAPGRHTCSAFGRGCRNPAALIRLRREMVLPAILYCGNYGRVASRDDRGVYYWSREGC